MHLQMMCRAGFMIVLAGVITPAGMTGCSRLQKKTTDKDAAVLSFHSFDGGGPTHSVTVEDESVVSFSAERQYSGNTLNHSQNISNKSQTIF